MSNENLRSITNHFQDVRLISLSSWRRANEILPRDRNGPYVVLQEGYDPNDLKMTVNEFILGRSGKWLSLGLFYRLPVPERRKEFVYGTAAEVVQVINGLPPKVAMLDREAAEEAAPAARANDEFAAAIRAGKNRPSAQP